MRLSTRGRYGLAAICELATRERGEIVPLKDIASRQSLSEGYLEQLFRSLRRAGFVRGVRGAQGGYTLAKRPEEITAGGVLRVLEGPIALVPCLGDEAGKAGQACSRGRFSECATRVVWARLASCMSRVLDSITLADLVGSTPGEAQSAPCADCRTGQEAQGQ